MAKKQSPKKTAKKAVKKAAKRSAGKASPRSAARETSWGGSSEAQVEEALYQQDTSAGLETQQRPAPSLSKRIMIPLLLAAVIGMVMLYNNGAKRRVLKETQGDAATLDQAGPSKEAETAEGSKVVKSGPKYPGKKGQVRWTLTCAEGDVKAKCERRNFSAEGKTLTIERFAGGQYSGLTEIFNANGSKKATTAFEANQRLDYQEFDKNGKVVKSCVYEGGKLKTGKACPAAAKTAKDVEFLSK